MSKFYDLYFKLKDMELSNVNSVDNPNTELRAIDSIDVSLRQDFEEEPLTYTFDPAQGYVPNRPPKAGEPGFAPQGRIN